MTYTIQSNSNIDFRATGKLKVIENIKNIISTVKYEVPYNRKFGISPDIIDNPLIKSKPLIISSIVEEIKRCEPRANVKSINIKSNENKDDLIIEVVVDID